MDKHFLEVAFGHRLGGDIYQYARGIDFSPVCLPRKEVSLEETRVFSPHSNDLLLIYQSLKSMVQGLANHLRETKRLSLGCCLFVRYTDFSSRTVRVNFKVPQNYAEEILKEINPTWKKISERRLAIQSIRIELLNIDKFPEQLCLFGTPISRKRERLQALLKKSS